MLDKENELKQKFDSLKEMCSNVHTRSQIETLLGELSTLQLEAALYGLKLNISNLQQTLEAKVKNFELEQSIDRFQTQEEQFLKAQRAAKLIEEEKEIARKIAALNNSYNEFIKNINKDIKRIEESNKRLDKIINKLEKENIIDHDLLNSQILTHEEILAQHKEHKEYYEHQKKINEEHKQVHEELEEVNKEITNLKQQLNKKDLKPKEIQELKNELEFYQEMLKIQKPYAKQLDEAKKETNQKIAQYEEARKAQGKKIEKLGNAIKERQKKEPEKYLEMHEKYTALKNQHEAINSNGVVKDKLHHDKVLTKINGNKAKSVADKIKEQAEVKDNIGSLCPSRTPNINSTNNKTRGL